MDLKKISAIFLLCLSLKGYDSIDEALKNGIPQGDVGFFTDYYKPKNNQEFHDAYYIATTMGLQYRSAFYKNMRLSVGFRAAFPLWQWHKTSQWWGNSSNGYPLKGDMALDFDSFERVLLSNTYLEYFDGDTNIKSGRFFLENEWMSNQVDGLWIRNRSLKDLMLEFYWIGQYGRVTPTTMRAFEDFKEANYSGYFYTAAKYYLGEIFWVKLYTFASYSIAFGAGTSANVEYKFSSSKVGLSLNTAGTAEFKNGKEYLDSTRKIKGGSGIDFDTKFYIEGKVSTATIGFNLGFIQSGKYSGWGSLNLINNTISPLGIGNVFNDDIVDTSLFYGTLYTTIDRVQISLLYGSASFVRPSLGVKHHRQNEVNLTTSFGFTQNVSGFINIYNTHLGNEAIPNVTQVQGGFSLSF